MLPGEAYFSSYSFLITLQTDQHWAEITSRRIRVFGTPGYSAKKIGPQGADIFYSRISIA